MPAAPPLASIASAAGPTAQLPHPNPRAAPQDLDASGEVDVVDLLALLGAFGDVDCLEQCVGDSGGQIAPGGALRGGAGSEALRVGEYTIGSGVEMPRFSSPQPRSS